MPVKFDSLAIIRDEKSAGTGGGDPAGTGTFLTRTLNTVHYDPDGLVSLASNQFDLDAGTYFIRARSPIYNGARVSTRLRNVTDSTDALYGRGFADVANNEQEVWFAGVVTIAGTKTFEVQMRIDSDANQAYGLGVEVNHGHAEIYTEVEIWRLVPVTGDLKISELSAITSLAGTEEFVLADSGTSKKITADDLLAGASPWELTTDLPLTTLTGWSSPGGWSTDGSKFIVGVGASQSRNVYQTRLRLATAVIQWEFQIPSTGRSGSPQRAGMNFRWDGANTGYPVMFAEYSSLNPASNGVVDTEHDGATAGPGLAQTFALDTWHTVRLHISGLGVEIFFNGTFKFTANIYLGLNDASYVGLYAYQTDAWFRNLKIWTPPLPA